MDIKPVRLQRKRVKGFKVISPNGLENVFVSRGFEFCNPYKIGSIFINEKRECSRPQYINKIKEKLKGKNLVCWCSLNEECHADLLLKIANEV